MAPSHSRASSSTQSNGQSAIEDPLSPYFLHHSNGPGTVLVSQVLTGENYASWSRAMTIALSVNNKLGFVDGSIRRPTSTDLSLLNSWTRNNNVVISWILNSVSKEISASVIFSETAAEIWFDLKDRFQQSNGPRVFQLRRDLINLVQDQSSVSVYFTKLKSLWEELSVYRPVCSCNRCTCGGVKALTDHYQMEYIMSFLMGLNDSFSQVRGQLLLMDPLPPINKVFSLISQEEQRRKIGFTSSTSPTNTMAFAVKNESPHKTNFTSSNYGQSTYGRGQTNYGRGQTNYGRGQSRGRPFCTYCNYHGHTIETCYKIHGYPPGFKQKQKVPAGNSNAVANQVSDQLGIQEKTNTDSSGLWDFF